MHSRHSLVMWPIEAVAVALRCWLSLWLRLAALSASVVMAPAVSGAVGCAWGSLEGAFVGRNRVSGTRVGKSSLSRLSLSLAAAANDAGAGVGGWLAATNVFPFPLFANSALEVSPPPAGDGKNSEDDDDAAGDVEMGSVPSESASGTGGAGGVGVGVAGLLSGLNVARSGCQMRLELLLLLLVVLVEPSESAFEAAAVAVDDDVDVDLVGSGGGKPSNLNGGENCPLAPEPRRSVVEGKLAQLAFRSQYYNDSPSRSTILT